MSTDRRAGWATRSASGGPTCSIRIKPHWPVTLSRTTYFARPRIYFAEYRKVDMTDSEILADLQSRQEIYDCVLRYGRGQDRSDHELIRSAFHEDALEHHGPYRGLSHELPDWSQSMHDGWFRSWEHIMLSHRAELDGDQAHGETYCQAHFERSDGSGVDVLCVRYIDRFERRAGVWRIAARVVVREWQAFMPVPDESDKIAAHLSGKYHVQPRRFPDDVSYERPLVVNLDATPRP